MGHTTTLLCLSRNMMYVKSVMINSSLWETPAKIVRMHRNKQIVRSNLLLYKIIWKSGRSTSIIGMDSLLSCPSSMIWSAHAVTQFKETRAQVEARVRLSDRRRSIGSTRIIWSISNWRSCVICQCLVRSI